MEPIESNDQLDTQSIPLTSAVGIEMPTPNSQSSTNEQYIFVGPLRQVLRY
jgi:hypothetical protein